jgi:hypothetical protein
MHFLEFKLGLCSHPLWKSGVSNHVSQCLPVRVKEVSVARLACGGRSPLQNWEGGYL